MEDAIIEAMKATGRELARKWRADLGNRDFGSHYLVGVGFTFTMVDAETQQSTGVAVENVFADGVEDASEEVRRSIAEQVIEVYTGNVMRALRLEVK